MKVMHRLFFEKEVLIWKPLRVGFHYSCNFLVERIREDSDALCFQVVYAIGLIWDFYNIIQVENTPRQQCRVKFQVSNNSGIKLFKWSIWNDRDCMERRNGKKWRYVTNLQFRKIYWGLVISICKILLTIWVVPSKAIFCASSTRNLWFIKPSSEMSSSNFL